MMSRPKRRSVSFPRRDFQAAAEEFSERGFEAGGVDRIAAKARVNKAMLYYHFKRKRALIEILRDMFRAVSEKARHRRRSRHRAPEARTLIATIIQEAAARPGSTHHAARARVGRAALRPDTFALMNAVTAPSATSCSRAARRQL
jgi:AcrR family transcriptional regulator